MILLDKHLPGRDSPAWDTLWAREWPGRIAVSVRPSAERVQRARERHSTALADGLAGADCPDESWRQALLDQLVVLAARRELPGDACPAIDVPRFVHGQSQGICDLFGARVQPQPDGNFYVYPLPADPDRVAAMRPAPVDTSRYWGAIEWTRYARAVTGGALPCRNPVMTGPFDTANYLLGTTVLLEWVHTEPQALHRFLATVTDALIAMMGAVIQAAGGTLCPLHFPCLRGGFDLCSEARSLVSAGIYEEFEAPYLQRIGEALGPFGVHSCGGWERTIPSVLRNPHLRAMSGQIRENDLGTLCRLADGRLTLSIGPSMNLHERFVWPDAESFYRHILEVVPDGQPFEVAIDEQNIPLWERLHREIRGSDYPWFRSHPDGA